MVKKRTRAISIVLATIILLVSLTGCGSTSSPKRVTETYFSAVKAGDMDKAIQCFTPALQAQYSAAISFSNSLFGFMGIGIDSEALLGGMIGASNTEAYKDYNFKVSDTTKTDSTHAKVKVDIYIDGNKSGTTTISCVKIDGEWYIAE